MQQYASRHRVLPPSLRPRELPIPYHHRFLTRPQFPAIWIGGLMLALLVIAVLLMTR